MLLITAIAGFLFWLVFFKFKWINLHLSLGGSFDTKPASVIVN